MASNLTHIPPRREQRKEAKQRELEALAKVPFRIFNALQASVVLGISEKKVRSLMKAGRIRVTRQDGNVGISYEDLREYAESLPREPEGYINYTQHTR